MADNVDTLVAEILSVVDVSTTEALTQLNRRHRTMVARAKCLRKRIAVASTTANVAEYPLDVIELYALEVAGVPYGKARRPDIYGYSQGTLLWSGPDGSGLIVADADAAGVTGITLIPTPTQTGLAITAFAAVKPDDLAAGGPASTIKVDNDFYNALVEGACATFLRRIGEGDPGTGEQIFDGACEEMRRRAARRFRGAGPAQIRVQGINA
jgi:hypothetical protein